MGPIGSKVIEYPGQRSNLCVFFLFPPRSLGRSSPNFEGRWKAAPDISLRVHFLKGQGHRGQRSNLFFFLFVPLLLPGPSFFERSRSSRSKVKFMGFFFCLFPYFSQVFGPIFTKLGGKVEGGPGY